MRRVLTVGLWALLIIGGISAFGYLRQQLLLVRQIAPALQVHHTDAFLGGAKLPPIAIPSLAYRPLPESPPTEPHFTRSPDPALPTITIIIDDLGNQWSHDKRALALQGDVTLAILPFSPFGERLANLAERAGREVILHAPMEPLSHPAWRGGLTRTMSEPQLKRALGDMLDDLPTVRGVNNHMGSALTRDRQPMNWVMEELGQRGLYFVDSRTTPDSQALLSARQHAIPSAKRDVFLDNVRTPKAIDQQFRTLLRLARKRGQAIAIGHPYPETLAYLEKALAQLDKQGVRLVPVSHVLIFPVENQAIRELSVTKPEPPLSSDTRQHSTEAPSKSI